MQTSSQLIPPHLRCTGGLASFVAPFILSLAIWHTSTAWELIMDSVHGTIKLSKLQQSIRTRSTIGSSLIRNILLRTLVCWASRASRRASSEFPETYRRTSLWRRAKAEVEGEVERQRDRETERETGIAREETAKSDGAIKACEKW